MKSTIIFCAFCLTSTKKGGQMAFLLYKRVKRKTAGASPTEKNSGYGKGANPTHAAPTSCCSAPRRRYYRPRPPGLCRPLYATRRAARARFPGIRRPPLPPRPLPGLYAATCRPSAPAGAFPYIRARRPLPGQRAAFARETGLYARAAPGTPPTTACRGTRPRPVRRACRVRRPRSGVCRSPKPARAAGVRAAALAG